VLRTPQKIKGKFKNGLSTGITLSLFPSGDIVSVIKNNTLLFTAPSSGPDL
jgi:hypothetical protein